MFIGKLYYYLISHFFQQIEDVGHLNHEKEELKFLEERMNDLCVFYSVRTRSRLSSVN
jgi:hypothetical protein